MSNNIHTELDLKERVVVVGLGVTGLSVVRYLLSKNIQPVVVDSREQPPGEVELKTKFPTVQYIFGAFDKDKLATAKQLVVSPGVSLKLPEIDYAQSQGVEIVGDIELFARVADAPVIAITGSNGKSTVTTLLGEIFNKSGWKAAIGGNIGVPALDLLNQGFEIYILELSSFQLETLYSLYPLAAVVLNVSEDHMDRYDSVASYIMAKKSIYKNAKHSVVNRDDEVVSKMLPDEGVIGFTLHDPQGNDFGLQNINSEQWICRNNNPLIKTTGLIVGGLHNVANIMAAMALCDSFDLNREHVFKAIKEFSGLPHRMQYVASSNGVNWINDSKATNVGAAKAAISGLTGKTLLIAGGESKDADLSPLKASVEKHVKAMILIGRDALMLEQACEGATQIVHASCMYDAVVKAKELAQPGDNILLSPACASFDMFDSYVHRGEVFNDAVKAVLA